MKIVYFDAKSYIEILSILANKHTETWLTVHTLVAEISMHWTMPIKTKNIILLPSMTNYISCTNSMWLFLLFCV